MLSEAKNKLLTQVGPGTPMGDYLRRYWFPIAATAEFDDKNVKPIRLLGEDLTLYKDLSGTYGLVDRHCPHRRADLSYGYVEKTGLRCNYHGWLMNETGACIEQPFEDTVNPNNRLKERCSTKAYPVRALRGLLWAYMGPQPAPELPVYEAFTWENGFVESFHSRFRDECLNREQLWTLTEARVVIEDFRQDYNAERPHSSLGYLSPQRFAAEQPLTIPSSRPDRQAGPSFRLGLPTTTAVSTSTQAID
jgi:nitrite reductase/ring-hydroxylating ferredoxin subunit